MITVSFSYKNGVRELVCSGHAGYDPGNDVVCAAASAITGALAAVLLKRAGNLAPSEEGAGKRDRKERLTEGEITPICLLRGDCSEGGGLSHTHVPHLRHDVAAKEEMSLSLPPSLTRSARSRHLPPQREARANGCVRRGDPSGEVLGMITPPAAATPHPSQLALQAETPSPQGEGLTDAQREVGGPSSPEAPRDDKGADTADMFSVSEPAGTGNAGPRSRAVGYMGSDNPSVACGDSSPYTGEPICLAVARREIPARADAKYSLTRMRNVGLRRRDMFAFGERCAACGGDNPSAACGDSSPYTGEPGGVSVSEGAGYCRIACAGDAAKPYFEFALVGLKKLAEAFPENVRVVGGE